MIRGAGVHLTALLFASIAFRMASALTYGSDAGLDHWWQHAVIYQIYPRSFKDSNGDGVGDLKGVISKMDYLAELGITAIWLSPIYQSPMVDFGYDISNFTAIHDEYGTMEDFEHLMAVSRRLDIKVILDFVPNHTSDQCDWFQMSLDRDPLYDDFYVWHDGVVDEKGQRQPPNNWQSVFSGPAWTWSPRRRQFYLHQFAGGQPDLNFRNSRVVAAMDDILRFWLDKGVDGFRVDAVNHLFEVADLRDEPLSGKTTDPRSYEYTDHVYTKDLPEVYEMVQHWRKVLDEYGAQHGGGERIMMTEAYADIKSLMDYYEDAKGTVGAHFPFNFLLITDLDRNSDARDFVHCLQTWLTYMPRGHTPNWVLGNHDRARVASRFGPDLVDAMNILLLTLPGVAVTYNGEEIGMRDHRDISWMDTVDPWARNSNPKEYRTLSRDPVRTPFQWDDTSNAGFSSAAKTWLPVHPDYKEVNLAAQKAAPASHYKVYKRLIDLRGTLPALLSGRFEAVALTRNVFAYKRELKGHPTAVVIINVGPVEELLNLTRLDGFVPTQLQVLVTSSGPSHSASESITAAVLRVASHAALLAVAHE